jgi:hypothetical protein
VIAAGKSEPRREAGVLVERVSGHSKLSGYATPAAVAARRNVGKTALYSAVANGALT